MQSDWLFRAARGPCLPGDVELKHHSPPNPFADSPHLEPPEIFLLLQTVINILLPPRIISTSRTKNFMLDASPAHCSTPGDPGKDLRREGLAESTSQVAYLGTNARRQHSGAGARPLLIPFSPPQR